ncbi:outer membrane beta-barrel protein [Flavobacterium sp.]|uniref:outer membrane beta-barrel protein n=1 Tax=Flavobacterium sp. TaxID=239 RepID=UPI0039E52754
MKKTLLTALFAFVTLAASAQYEYRDSNRIGISVGINQFNLNTDNFTVNPEIGWNLGLSVRGNFYNDFDMVYAMQFSENKFSVPTTSTLGIKEDVEYKLPSAQVSLMLSYKFIENHLSAEFGPMLQINDKFKIDDKDNRTNIIDGTTYQADDILKISKFNFYPVVGLTAGVKHLRLNIQYAYGLTNMLGKLNEQDDVVVTKKFNGHAGILTGNLIIYL